jgi:hypothetical protein
VIPAVAERATLTVGGEPVTTAEEWVEAIPFRLIFPSADRYAMLSGAVARGAGVEAPSASRGTAPVAGTWRELDGERTFTLRIFHGGAVGAPDLKFVDDLEFLDDRRIISARYQVMDAGNVEGLVVTVYTHGLTYEFTVSEAEWERDDVLDIARDIATVWEEANEG